MNYLLYSSKALREKVFSKSKGISEAKNVFTFEFVVFRVCGEEDVRKELLKAVAGIPRSVLHVGPHRLVELHQELLRRCPQLLNHLIPLVNIFRLQS